MTVGISAQLKADGVVVAERFAERVRQKLPVGVCACGGRLYGRIDKTKRVVWFATVCASCGDEKAAPGGRTATPGPDVPGQWVDPLMLDEWRARDAAVLGERVEEAA